MEGKELVWVRIINEKQTKCGIPIQIMQLVLFCMRDNEALHVPVISIFSLYLQILSDC